MANFRYLVNDVDEAIEFYKKLGFDVSERYGSAFAIMRRDDVELWVSGPDTFAAKPMPDGSKPSLAVGIASLSLLRILPRL